MSSEPSSGPRQALTEWFPIVARYLGLAGAAYEFIIDQLEHPEVLIFCGGLAGLKSVIEEQIKRNNGRES